MAMSDEARKMWNTPAGGSLMGAMMGLEPRAPDAQALLDQLKALNRAGRGEKVDSRAPGPELKGDPVAGHNAASDALPGVTR